MSDGRSSTALVIVLPGDLDVACGPALSAILDVPPETALVVLDLSQARYVDSSALGAFVRLRKRLDAGATVALAGANANVARIFEICGLSDVFQPFGSVDEALRYYEVIPQAAARRLLEPGSPD